MVFCCSLGCLKKHVLVYLCIYLFIYLYIYLNYLKIYIFKHFYLTNHDLLLIEYYFPRILSNIYLNIPRTDDRGLLLKPLINNSSRARPSKRENKILRIAGRESLSQYLLLFKIVKNNILNYNSTL